MNSSVFSENMKKFRIAKNYTQERVAEILCVNAQTVSRWECGTTLPDVLLLPEIARLYGVTVDDFFKENSVAYKNYAQRLASVYERSRDPEDFMRCMLEYQRLMRSKELSIEDKWNYAIVHHFMMTQCKDVAMEWYDKALAEAPEKDVHSWNRARSCRLSLLVEIGRGEDVLVEQKKRVEKEVDDPSEWQFLIEIYSYLNRHEEAYDVFRQAIECFPEKWELYIHGGDICRVLKRYEEAFSCYEKAGALGTHFWDEKWSMAECYNQMGKYARCYQCYTELAEELRRHGYDVEAEIATENAKKAKASITDNLA